MQNALAKSNNNNNNCLAELKGLIEKNEVAERFKKILKDKANQFMASIVNMTASDSNLLKCEPGSIISAALIAATMNLPIDKSLGFAAVVPYKSKGKTLAQFQIQWKGFVQLALRTGQYRRINATVIYEDEFVKEDIRTGSITLKSGKQRRKAEYNKIIGYYAYFELMNGFEHELYMTKEEVDAHARMYSKAYQYDIKNKTKTSLWSKSFHAMGVKTPIKLLLGKWGLLSTELKQAIKTDQMISSDDGNLSYADNPRSYKEENVITVDSVIEEHVSMTESLKLLGQIIDKLVAEDIDPNNFWEKHKIEDPEALPVRDLQYFLDYWSEATEGLQKK